MKVFLDTNVLIDILARRDGFFEAASNVVNMGIEGNVTLCTTSMSFATTLFVVRKVIGYSNAIAALQKLEDYVEIVEMDGSQCHIALHADMPDFEDMLQYEAALAAHCDVLLTRNKKHFPKETLTVLTPIEFLNQISQNYS